jgi:catechol 2,3-dioxygenase-like lactoylglutathione lyase family enzyme
MIRQLAHICIHTPDLESTSRFYQEGLGLECGIDFIRDDEPFGFYLKLGNETFIEVFKGEASHPGNINHLAIQVDDMDAVINRLRQKGYEVTDKSMGADHAWQAWTADPNGVRIEFHEYTPESLQLTGGTCMVDW